MNLYMRFILLISLLLFSCWEIHYRPSDLSYNNDLIIKAHEQIKKYHSGTTQSDFVVKVVYFHGNDLAPLNNWRERLTRTLDDVSNFYKEEFYKYDIKIEGIPFDKNEGKYNFYVVEGDSVSRDYNIKDGERIAKEIHNKTNGQIDFSKDYVLIINGLCYQREDNTYVFHSPYFGLGSAINGLCMVADCELLDSRLLTDTVQKMAFSEMMIDYKKCSVAEFNSWYIGGIAHEMGHIFGLPHNYGHPRELNDSSISLMGQYGSRHFREYLWEGEKSSFFSSASILQLISHPVFTQSSKNINKSFKANIDSLGIVQNRNGLELKAGIKTDEKPYGAVALIRPSNLSEYFNQSYSCSVSDNKFANIDIGQLRTGDYNLQFMFLFPNGSKKRIYKYIKINKEGIARITDVPGKKEVDIHAFYKKLQKKEMTEVVKKELKILEGILNPPELISPKTYDGEKLFLSDAKWEEAKVGWGKIARNYFSGEEEYKFFLVLQGELYSKGLYAHSPSSYVFDVDRKWTTFSAIVGIRDYAHIQGSARFTVIGDGKVLFESQALRVNQKETVKIDISDVKILELKAEGTEGHNHNSWAIWVDPIIER